MTELPAEVREKAARAACDTYDHGAGDGGWESVVDAVAEVLAEHQAERPTPAVLLGENSILRSRNERLSGALDFAIVHAGQVTAERDALQARVESLRAALEGLRDHKLTRGAPWVHEVADAALAADDRAAGPTEEVSDDHS